MKTHISVVLIAGLIFYTLSSIAKSKSTGEPLYAIKLSDQMAKVWVRSTGCTKKGHFDLRIKDHDSHQSLLITRLKPDNCKRMPTMKALSFTLPASTAFTHKPLYLDNPLSLWRSPNYSE